MERRHSGPPAVDNAALACFCFGTSVGVRGRVVARYHSTSGTTVEAPCRRATLPSRTREDICVKRADARPLWRGRGNLWGGKGAADGEGPIQPLPSLWRGAAHRSTDVDKLRGPGRGVGIPATMTSAHYGLSSAAGAGSPESRRMGFKPGAHDALPGALRAAREKPKRRRSNSRYVQLEADVPRVAVGSAVNCV